MTTDILQVRVNVKLSITRATASYFAFKSWDTFGDIQIFSSYHPCMTNFITYQMYVIYIIECFPNTAAG